MHADCDDPVQSIQPQNTRTTRKTEAGEFRSAGLLLPRLQRVPRL